MALDLNRRRIESIPDRVFGFRECLRERLHAQAEEGVRGPLAAAAWTISVGTGAQQ